MKKIRIILFCIVATVMTSQAQYIIRDAFGSGSVSIAWRIYENTIDTAWRKCVGESESTISDGVAMNDSTVAASGYPDRRLSEDPLFSFFSGIDSVSTQTTLHFDYSVAAGFYRLVWLPWQWQGQDE